MRRSLSASLSPLPVSISTRWPRPSTSRQLVAYSQRLSSSQEASLDQMVLGTTPCMAPPSRRKLPPFTSVRVRSPKRIPSTLLEVTAKQRRERRRRGGPGQQGPEVDARKGLQEEHPL